MKEYFPGNSYRTPAERRRSPGDRLCLGTRLWFHLKYIRVLAESRGFARRDDYGPENWAWTSWEIFNIIESAGGQVEIDGLDHVREASAPFVIVANHMSTLETHILPVLILPIADMTFVVKDSLVKHRYFGPIMRACRPIAVSRRNPREDLVTVMTEGQRILSEGRSLVIFPQSTRSRVFDPAQFNSLAAKLAEKAGVPLIPVALKTDFWENGRFLRDIGPIRRRRRVHLEFGAPLGPGLPARETHARAVDFIVGRLKQWGVAIRETEN